ncbi:2OG-Fe(II) oxygenase [Amycolatopsis sp. NPDC006131]|uniref:2OG-Fe(II) oxygenase n=1 Tax=Amycolatopsis sp. NPDC006131 TaxID=3156731 RepID=UPI00339F97C1
MNPDHDTIAEWAERFRNAKPFPHLVLDNIWDNSQLEEVAAEFPEPDDGRWITYPDPKEWGKRCGGPNMWGTRTRAWFDTMRTPEIADLLEQVTGIAPLTPDDIGGGMHMTTEGGRLASHVDFNIHPTNPALERRINLLVFLNPGWRKEWGGTLLLGEHREVEVVPEFNRTVLFATSDRSWHGHPDPIVGDHRRKSLACYFYAPARATAAEAHSTVWQEDAGAR